MARADQGKERGHSRPGYAPCSTPGWTKPAPEHSLPIWSCRCFLLPRMNGKASVPEAEGIAAAEQRGVRFGREIKPLPDNFSGELRPLAQWPYFRSEAARRCRMPSSTFYRKAGGIREDSTNVV